MSLYVLATGVETPDAEFHALEALAREILRRRLAEPRQPRLRYTDANLGRGDLLPNGVCVSLRFADGQLGGRGSLLGYAFLPRSSNPTRDLMAAVALAELVEARSGERAA
jgi:hypothetical protein